MDFSSSPKKQKPIVVAIGFCRIDFELKKAEYFLERFDCLESLEEFSSLLKFKGPWAGGFDLPFSMPETLINFYGWPTNWRDFASFYCTQSKSELKNAFKFWCNLRPKGKKFAWRVTDKLAGSSPAMRWTNPPVAWMMHSGIKKMIDAGLIFPSHCKKFDFDRVVANFLDFSKSSSGGYHDRLAFEVYPGYSIRKIIRKSYKTDRKIKDNQMRISNRELVIDMLLKGLIEENIYFSCSRQNIEKMCKDHKGDFLDASICAIQVSSALLQPNFGLGFKHSLLEGWIVPVNYEHN